MSVYSTVEITSCRCECQGKSHAEWNNPEPQAGTRQRIHTALTQAILAFLTKYTLGAEPPAAGAYPTEARLQAKVREKEGHKAVKRKKHMEDLHDDLGDDLRGLGSDIMQMTADYSPHTPEPADYTEQWRDNAARTACTIGMTGTGGFRTPGRGTIIVSSPRDILELARDIPGKQIWYVDGGENGNAAMMAQIIPHTGNNTLIQTAVPVCTADDGTSVLSAIAMAQPRVVTTTSTAWATWEPVARHWEYL